MHGPLDGIRVFDLTHAAVGPWAAMLLGSLGADVIKVEHPEGDIIRVVPPNQRGLGVVYSHCNLNKRGIILDLKNPEHREVAYRLVEKADIFMENMRPGTAERLGFGYEQVARLNPRIIYASASAWGRTGPMREMGGADPSVQAFCGWASITGAPGGKGELFRHFAHLDLTTSSFLVGAILQALLVREQTGRGMRVELTMLGAAINLQVTRVAEFFATGKTPPPMGSACTTTVPHQGFLCQDKRWLAVGVVNDGQWQGLCRALGLDELAADPRFATNPARVENRDQLIPLLEQVFSTKPTTWWLIRLTKEGVPHGLFLSFQELRHHQHCLQNRFIEAVDIPHQGRLLVGGLPWRFEKTPARLSPPPAPGQHNEEVLREFGLPVLKVEAREVEPRMRRSF